MSKKSQVRSTYFGLIQVCIINECCAAEAIGLRVVAIEVHRASRSVVSLKRTFPRLMTFTATGRSTAHTNCRNEVKDLKHSVKLCGRAVADNVNERGNRLKESHRKKRSFQP